MTVTATSTWAARIHDAARTGSVLGVPDDAPTPDPAQADTWGPDRRLPADQLRDALLTLTASGDPVDPRGLRIRGLAIGGWLDLTNVHLGFPLALEYCALDHTALFIGAHLPSLSLTGSHLTGTEPAAGGGHWALRMGRLHLDGDLDLTHTRTTGGVRAKHATIGGLVDLTQAHLHNPDGVACDLDHAHISADVRLNGTQSHGQVRAEGARLDAGLTIGPARDRDGNISRDDQRNLICASLCHTGNTALHLDSTHIGQELQLSGAHIDGAINALLAQIGGHLNLQPARDGNREVVPDSDGNPVPTTLHHPNDIALNLNTAHIDQSVFLSGVRVDGAVDAAGAEIGGQLNLVPARDGTGQMVLDSGGNTVPTTLHHPNGTALNLNTAHIDQDAFLSGVRVDGAINATGARIGGHLTLEPATDREGQIVPDSGGNTVPTTINASDGTALNLNTAHIGQHLLLSGAHIDGAIDAAGARIGGHLTLEPARDSERRVALDSDGNPVPTKINAPDGTALNLNAAHIGQGLQLSGAHIEGAINALLAQIGGQLALVPAWDGNEQVERDNRDPIRTSLHRPGGTALNLYGARIDQDVFLIGILVDGAIDALQVQVGGVLTLEPARVGNRLLVRASDGSPFPTTLRNSGRIALDLESARIDRSVFLTGVCVDGAVDATRARIGGQLVLQPASQRDGAHLEGPTTESVLTYGNGVALSLSGARVDGDLYLFGSRLEGRVNATNAWIGGDLTFSRGTHRTTIVHPPAGDTFKEPAVNLDRATISGDLDLGGLAGNVGGETAQTPAPVGPVSAQGATIKGALKLDGAQLQGDPIPTSAQRRRWQRSALPVDADPHRLAALNLDDATLGQLRLEGVGKVSGELDLRSADIADLRVDPDGGKLPKGCHLLAEGITVEDMHGAIRNEWKIAQQWLSTRPVDRGFVPQPWKALADVYDRDGRPGFSRRLSAAAARRTTRQASLLHKPPLLLYGLVVGYGYYPLPPWPGCSPFSSAPGV